MKKRCLNKQGYFFLIDSILALGVLAVGGFLIFSLYLQSPSKEGPTILSEDIMDFFANTKFKEVDNPYARIGGELWATEGSSSGLCPGEQFIFDGEKSLLQQLGMFYKKSEANPCYLQLANKFIDQMIVPILPNQYKFEFWLDNSLIYPDAEQTQSKNAAKVLIPSKKMVYGILDPQTGEMFGPYTAEALVWQ